jgi:5,10-methylenetetrahydrofolate reductase
VTVDDPESPKGQFRNKLREKDWIVTVELSPPKGTATEEILHHADRLREKADAFNITDNQRAIMRMSPLALSHLLKEKGHDPILQLTCRDRNRLALQSELLSAYALGIENFCFMTGDHPLLGDHPNSKPVYDCDSIQLISLAKGLERGEDFAGRKLTGTPKFIIGAVMNPLAEPLEPHLIKLRKKVAAGVDFIQTQPVFDLESLERFLEMTSDIEVRFLIGITPLKSPRMAEFMNNKILAKPIPAAIVDRMDKAKEPAREGISIAAELMIKIKSYVTGFHIMPIGLERNLPDLFEQVGI